MRQRAEQHVGRPAPGGPAALEPVPLNLLAGRMLDLDGVPALHPRHASQCGRSPRSRLAGEARVAERCSRAGPPRHRGRWPRRGGSSTNRSRTYSSTTAQRVGDRRPAHPGLAFAVQIGPDGLAVATQVAGDGRDRPAPFFNACASTSSPCVSMTGGSLRAGWRRNRQPRRGPARIGGPSGPTRRSRVGNFSDHL